MSRKHFSWLLVLTLIVGGVILLMPVKTGHESGLEVEPLIPGMGKWVNDVERVHIIKAGNQTVATLVRGDQGWVVEENESYTADWPRLKTLLAALAQARITEPKTANPAYFDRLGLRDVSDGDSSAIMVEIGTGETATRVLIGHAAQGREGQYVRFPQNDQALLIDRAIDVAAETRDWLLRNIIDLSEAEVVEVDITHPDGERVSVRKNSADEQNFTLQDVPQGREVQSSWSVNALGQSLSGLLLDEVTADSHIDWSNATQVRVLTADGVEALADLVTSDDKNWIRVAASAYTRKAAAANDQGEKQQAADGKEDTAAKDLAERVETINHRVRGWAYVIPQYKFQVMNKRLEDLLKPQETKTKK